jgi:hypothetical protein
MFGINNAAFIIKNPTTVTNIMGEPQLIVDAVPHPTSVTVSCNPNLSTMAFDAGPSAFNIIVITMETPVNPTPTNIPDLNAFAGCILKMMPTMKKIIGIITDDPRLTIALIICISFTLLVSY